MNSGDLFDRADESPGFSDGKDPEALRTIGEVAKALGIRQHVLRYWEEQFPMLKPLKRSGGRRYYRPEDVRLVERIDSLVHREGYTLKGARKALIGASRSPGGAAPMTAPAQSSPGESQQAAFVHRARLIALRNSLAKALHSA